jgi:hypothetical protein
LTHIQKVWLLTQTAELIAKKDREKTAVMLDSAAAEARRIDVSDPDRPRAFFAVTNAMLLIDRDAAWDFAGEAIKSSNSVDTFSGEDGQLLFQISNKGIRGIDQTSELDFDVAPLFSKLANDNFEKAVELAATFKGQAPRANAIIAIAQSVLSGKRIEHGSESRIL